jgi:hypothetical protein
LEKSDPIGSHGLHAPLVALFDALLSLDDGKLLPLLVPKKKPKGGRARASALRASLIGVSVFTVNRLIETGMLAPAAQKAVAQKLKISGIKSARGAGTISARTVRGWCEHVSEDVGRHSEAAQTYDFLITDPEAVTDGLAPSQARTVLLDRLGALTKKIRAQEGA